MAMFFLFFFFFSYQKSYAMLYISDDAFLAKAAIAQSVMNGSSRMVFGLMYDKVGFKVISTQSIYYSSIMWKDCVQLSALPLQNSFFIQSVLSAALSFIFVNLMLFEGNEVGAKVFYIILSSAIAGILPGFSCRQLHLFYNVKNFISQDFSHFLPHKSWGYLDPNIWQQSMGWLAPPQWVLI